MVKAIRVSASCALSIAAVAAAGCGGGGSTPTTTAAIAPATTAAATTHAGTPYVVRMRKLGLKLATTITVATSTNSKTAPAKDAANLVKVQHALMRAAAGLDAISPPTAVRADHALLLKGVREYASELDGVIRKIRAGQVAALGSITNLRGLADMKRASDAIVAKGYPIVP